MKRMKQSAWVLCEQCSTSLPSRDVELHSKDCPPNTACPTHCFISENKLYGNVGVKNQEEVKGVTPHDVASFVFLSQSAIQLCELAIGDWAIVQQNDKVVVRRVWPTKENSLTSVLFIQAGLDLTEFSVEKCASVFRFASRMRDAGCISVVITNAPKAMELNRDIKLRLNKLHVDRVIKVDNLLSMFYFGKNLIFQVKAIESRIQSLDEELSELKIGDDFEFYKINSNTSWKLYSSQIEFNRKTLSKKKDNIGGLDREIGKIKNLVLSAIRPIKNSIHFQPCRSIILYGNSGTGKTLLASNMGEICKVNSVFISPSDLYSQSESSSEEVLQETFKSVLQTTPSLLVIDELDIFCPSRSSRLSDNDKKIVAALLQLLDDIHANDNRVFVLATTNRLDAIDGGFRRTGRFDREIEIPVPNATTRLEILKSLLFDIPCSIADEDLASIASDSHGFVGSDLVALVSRAAMKANEHQRSALAREDFRHALTRVAPSAMREVQIEVPNVKWSDIGGEAKLKLILRQCVEWPLKHADSFKRLGVTPPRGVLMYGPPGCSKTMIARALATESGLNFLAIKGPELFSKWVGESERAVREVFRKARQVAPSIIFFDEIDALGGERAMGGGAGGSSNSVQERVLAQLLTELDGVTPLGDVTVVAATNRPDRIDKALLRPGRLDRIVYVPLPDMETRRDIIKIKFSKMPIIDVDPAWLVDQTDGYSGAEINALCHEAAMAALEEDIESTAVKKDHFSAALSIIRPRTPASLLKLYEEYKC